jgi:hypothetical protein
MAMKRKLWIILSLVLVLSIVCSSSAFAVNPVVDTFLGGRVDLNSMISLTTGYGTLRYDNAGHPGTTYTCLISITYVVKSTQLFETYTTYTRSQSAQNGNVSVTYDAPLLTLSYSVTNLGKISELGEIWSGNTDIIKY